MLTTTNVLEQATYDSGGRKEVRDCSNCGFHDRAIVYLPRLTRPGENDCASSSGGSSSYSFSSTSSSSSSSSSGGGFSSGGGASGSW